MEVERSLFRETSSGNPLQHLTVEDHHHAVLYPKRQVLATSKGKTLTIMIVLIACYVAATFHLDTSHHAVSYQTSQSLQPKGQCHQLELEWEERGGREKQLPHRPLVLLILCQFKSSREIDWVWLRSEPCPGSEATAQGHPARFAYHQQWSVSPPAPTPCPTLINYCSA